jgi:hypothetical protein
MHLFVTISLVLLVILATLHFLAKVKTENLGAFFKWSGYLVLMAALALLVCLLFRGVRQMTHSGGGGAKMECKAMHKGMKGGKGMLGRCSGMQDCSGMNKMNCSHGKGMGMKECSGMGKMDCGSGHDMVGAGCCACCGDMEMMGKGRMRSESTTDTIDGKIIKKEIEIIEK